MKYLSVCSGIEAATVAWHGLGWTPVAFAEIEAFPAAVLAHHYPTVPNLGDLTKYRKWPEELLAEVDLLVGGTPCQAFSVAGQRRSLDDERGNLSLVYVNLYHHINEVRRSHGRPPAIALWENVPGVLSTKDNAFGCFVGGLLGCDEAPATESGKWDKAGFLGSETVRVGYRVLDAQYFGVAQRRRRVFLVAVPCELVERFGERACPSEILSLRESVLGNPPTRGASWEGAARDTTACAASRSRCGGVAGTLDSNYHKGCGERAGVEREVVIDAPATCGTLSDGAHMGGGSTGRTPTAAESCPSVANALTARMHKGINTTVDEGQTPIVTHGGVFGASETFVFTGDGVIADPIGASESRTYTHEGTTFRLHNCVGQIASSVAVRTANTGANGHGVADEVSHTIDQVQGQAVAFTKSKRAQSAQDNESWVPGDVAPTQNQFDTGDTRATTVVAFRENTRSEVQYVDPPHAITSGGGKPGQGYCGIQHGMQVRRLCPAECEALQGFPTNYTLITVRGKPAADGPRYRALGNSMAVPCMWWLGRRIDNATRRDTP